MIAAGTDDSRPFIQSDQAAFLVCNCFMTIASSVPIDWKFSGVI